MQCRGEQERASAINNLWHRMKDKSRSDAYKKVQAKSRSNGHKLVEMLCQSDHERSFISDVARYGYILGEHPPVAPSATAVLRTQNYKKMKMNCFVCLPQACTLPSSLTIRVLLKLSLGSKDIGGWAKSSFTRTSTKMTTHTGV